MKNSRFTETQITRSIKEHESGKSAIDICQELKIGKNTFYLWKKKYSGMDADLLRKHKELEREKNTTNQKKGLIHY